MPVAAISDSTGNTICRYQFHIAKIVILVQKLFKKLFKFYSEII